VPAWVPPGGALAPQLAGGRGESSRRAGRFELGANVREVGRKAAFPTASSQGIGRCCGTEAHVAPKPATSTEAASQREGAPKSLRGVKRAAAGKNPPKQARNIRTWFCCSVSDRHILESSRPARWGKGLVAEARTPCHEEAGSQTGTEER
jgi:hypothetical protein